MFLLAFVAAVAGAQGQPLETGEELLVSRAAQGQHGGRLVVALRSEPRTLNPVLAADSPSREVIRRMMADLVHINRASQQTEPALAKSWRASKDGLRYTLKLRRGLRFSDGQPLTADDVVLTFQVYLDEKVHSPQRDLLLVGGKPIVVRKVDAQTVVFELSQPYAPAERLFDSIAILPRHLLKTVFDEGKFAQAWGLNVPVHQIAGMGPFRLKEYAAGQRIVLERNPYYWKVDQQSRRLPYLDEIVFLIVPNEDAQVIRFQAAETDV
ncbi:MAG: ABC transporter substrate-binding protein, partial [Candidatus Acidiferrales bacterium]